MELLRKKSRQETHECPVCLDKLRGTERTLSCGHVFCHDCLVETLVGKHDGFIRETITCPICKHLTFISVQKASFMSLLAERASDEAPVEGQTLAVPHLSPFGQLRRARRSFYRPNWMPSCLKGLIQRCRRQRMADQSVSQIFIISAQGRPMDEFTLRNGKPVFQPQQQPRQSQQSQQSQPSQPPPQRKRRNKICTTVQCLILLLIAIAILALVAFALPQILLFTSEN